MGLLEKIKNALFEEEYVEVEEKPKKVKKESVKKDAERPIAKKVVLPAKKEVKVEELEDDELLDEDFEISPEDSKEPERENNGFVIMNEDDFKVDEEPVVRPSEPQIVKVIDNSDYNRSEKSYYQGKKEKQPYGLDDNRSSISGYNRNSDTNQYGGAYERKEDRTHFKPSPIISPIYGILDKNYRKEDVVSKREVRLTSSYARENLSVDDVRKKAYGTLSDTEANKKAGEEPMKDVSFEVDKKEDESNLLVDLSDDREKPTVKEVTMGDALEYFEDLGLEYNVDYVDATKEKSAGRRSRENYEETPVVVSEEAKKEEEKSDVDTDSDDNLFDLIDSMYKEND